jgi:ribonuclease P protein component
MTRSTFRSFERLRDPRDFRRAFDRRRSASNDFIVVYVAENDRTYARLGISVGRKKVRRAVDRNRFKRLIREAFRVTKVELPTQIDIVVVPRGAPMTFQDACISLSALVPAAAKRITPRPAEKT